MTRCTSVEIDSEDRLGRRSAATEVEEAYDSQRHPATGLGVNAVVNLGPTELDSKNQILSADDEWDVPSSNDRVQAHSAVIEDSATGRVRGRNAVRRVSTVTAERRRLQSSHKDDAVEELDHRGGQEETVAEDKLASVRRTRRNGADDLVEGLKKQKRRRKKPAADLQKVFGGPVGGSGADIEPVRKRRAKIERSKPQQRLVSVHVDITKSGTTPTHSQRNGHEAPESLQSPSKATSPTPQYGDSLTQTALQSTESSRLKSGEDGTSGLENPKAFAAALTTVADVKFGERQSDDGRTRPKGPIPKEKKSDSRETSTKVSARATDDACRSDCKLDGDVTKETDVKASSVTSISASEPVTSSEPILKSEPIINSQPTSDSSASLPSHMKPDLRGVERVQASKVDSLGGIHRVGLSRRVYIPSLLRVVKK